MIVPIIGVGCGVILVVISIAGMFVDATHWGVALGFSAFALGVWTRQALQEWHER